MNHKPKFGGFTDDQVAQILEQVASTINVACAILREKAAEPEEVDISLTLHGLDAMLNAAGALADSATGGNVIGDMHAWLCGPLFHRDRATAAAHAEGGAA